MIMDTNDILTRFHRTLVEEIRNRRPEYLQEPFTVAEIYQNLVPYGTHRDRLGIQMNGDYEDALLRILAGEGGYLILDSEPALRVLRQELESSNPNTGVYREYAAVDVRLDPARIPFAGITAREGAAEGDDRSISEIVNDAVRQSMREDQEDLAAFEDRIAEPTMTYEALLKDLKAHGKL